MMTSVAATIVRRWVGLYTHGLARELRDGRRAEIESDLWAHAEDAYALGHPPSSLDVEMLTRLASGMPADIAWRWSHRSATRSVEIKEMVMREPRSHQVLAAVGVGLATIGLAFAVLGLVVIQQNTADRPADVQAASVGTLAMIAGLTLVLIGLLVVRRDPTIGRQMAIVGGVVIVAATFTVFAWAWPVGIALAVPAVIGVVRARQVVEIRQRQPA